MALRARHCLCVWAQSRIWGLGWGAGEGAPVPSPQPWAQLLHGARPAWSEGSSRWPRAVPARPLSCVFPLRPPSPLWHTLALFVVVALAPCQWLAGCLPALRVQYVQSAPSQVCHQERLIFFLPAWVGGRSRSDAQKQPRQIPARLFMKHRPPPLHPCLFRPSLPLLLRNLPPPPPPQDKLTPH